MGRRAKPAKVKTKAKRPLVRKAPTEGAARVQELEKRLAESLEREKEALEQQTATSEILRVISRSQTDVQPVFDAIISSAVRLLRGFVAAMSRISGDQLELAAFTSTDPVGDAAVRAAFPQALHSDWPHSRVVR